MARIRTDLVGCVYVGMTPYFAGDLVPDGVVDPVFLESGDGPVVGSVSADEAAYSEDTGIVSTGDTNQVETPAEPGEVAAETVAKTEEVEEVTEEEPPAEQVEEVPPVELGEFDPSQASVRTVRDYIAMNPDAKERVLALEAAGQARKSLIGE